MVLLKLLVSSLALATRFEFLQGSFVCLAVASNIDELEQEATRIRSKISSILEQDLCYASPFMMPPVTVAGRQGGPNASIRFELERSTREPSPSNTFETSHVDSNNLDTC